MKKERSSNIELLRILAMFFIVVHHAIVHGVLGEYAVNNIYSGTNVVNHLATITTADMLIILGKTGVGVFVIITGYFMSTSKFKGGKLVRLWLPIWFYSVIGLAVGIFSGKFDIGALAIVKAILPITFVVYWFMTAYVVLYCAVPLLNVLWQSVNLKMKWYLLSFLFVIDVIVPTLLSSHLADSFGSNAASQFLLFYFVGALLREKNALDGSYAHLGRLLFFGSWIIYTLTVIVFMYFSVITDISFLASHAQHFAEDGSFLVFGMAVGLFVMIGSHPIKSNKLINRVSLSMFGVYLIHDNYYLRVLVWHKLFHMERLVQLPVWQMLINVLSVIVLVFVVSIVIDMCRIVVFNKFENWFSDAVTRRFANYFGLLKDRLLLQKIRTLFYMDNK